MGNHQNKYSLLIADALCCTISRIANIALLFFLKFALVPGQKTVYNPALTVL